MNRELRKFHILSDFFGVIDWQRPELTSLCHDRLRASQFPDLIRFLSPSTGSSPAEVRGPVKEAWYVIFRFAPTGLNIIAWGNAPGTGYEMIKAL